MVQLIKKGGLRERANRSRSYQGSENTETSLRPNRYQTAIKTQENLVSSSLKPTESTLDDHPVNSSK
ncbi:MULTISPECIES: hypothetical protein [Acinetobacter]|uniref:hypothetical protein n=1 Tax=Acinetobacter TaxID=469 RepID=UPI000C232DDE|nr:MULTISPECIES: hypothetical protein [Acinetobacter]MDM1337141.1 hypothetical protein [Acinetobacter pseudolwoffii]MEE1123855.1 hypothetical protein [Acinetobacter pseudolwoffii]PJI29896.1 hypothetical protein CU478_07540 [Acinetobacter pseudolwoffii]PJI33346.1 hypothetical protein CU318_14045 [Acinetobacter pseudolwoffii]